MATSKSWNHGLKRRTYELLLERAKQSMSYMADELRDSQATAAATRQTQNPICCSAAKCSAPSEWEHSFDYVTGRKGRVSTVHRYLCGKHAARVAAIHGISVDGLPEPEYDVGAGGPSRGGRKGSTPRG